MPHNNPKCGNGLLQSIRMGNTFSINEVKYIILHLQWCAFLIPRISHMLKLPFSLVLTLFASVPSEYSQRIVGQHIV